MTMTRQRLRAYRILLVLIMMILWGVCIILSKKGWISLGLPRVWVTLFLMFPVSLFEGYIPKIKLKRNISETDDCKRKIKRFKYFIGILGFLVQALILLNIYCFHLTINTFSLLEFYFVIPLYAIMIISLILFEAHMDAKEKI